MIEENMGIVKQVMGPVVDVEFSSESFPPFIMD